MQHAVGTAISGGTSDFDFRNWQNCVSKSWLERHSIAVVEMIRFVGRRMPGNYFRKSTFCTDADGITIAKSLSRKNVVRFSIDRSGMTESDILNKQIPGNKELLTPLAKELRTLIQLKGPISLHDYMSHLLHHGVYGYYQSNSDKIGEKGDFITSPEISQLFGEMLAIWCISIWEKLGRPKNIKLIELGPGNGTLMKDVLKVIRKFPELYDALNIYMVELSESMQKIQQQKLQCGELSIENRIKSYKSPLSTNKISWCSFFNQIPIDSNPNIILAQEFLDVFPVHQFAFTPKGWREKLVDLDTSNDSPYHFRIVLSPNATPASISLLNKNLCETSQLKEGDSVEICPMALAITEDITKVVTGSGKGAALFIDYGETFTQEDSIRAFQRHKQGSILSQPGLHDVTADVDFGMLAKCASKKGASVHGAVTQGEFLLRMGIIERLKQLIDLDTTSDIQANELLSSMKILVDQTKMGSRFKILSIAHNSIQVPGFSP